MNLGFCFALFLIRCFFYFSAVGAFDQTCSLAWCHVPVGPRRNEAWHSDQILTQDLRFTNPFELEFLVHIFCLSC